MSDPDGSVASSVIEETAPPAPSLKRPLIATAIVTAVVTALSWLTPSKHAATAVGLGFLGATWFLVLRGDEAKVKHHGLALGGIFERTPLEPKRLLRDGAKAAAGGLALAALVFPIFLGGYRVYHHVHTFHWSIPPKFLDDLAGQILVIALPEEAFFRGYLQTSFTDGFGGSSGSFLDRAEVKAILLTSVIFAIGHVLTDPRPARLAVFFPSLLFGLVRAKTKGIGTGLTFHALCNLYVAVLAHGFS